MDKNGKVWYWNPVMEPFKAGYYWNPDVNAFYVVYDNHYYESYKESDLWLPFNVPFGMFSSHSKCLYLGEL